MNPWVNLTWPCTIHIEWGFQTTYKVWATWGNLGVFFMLPKRFGHCGVFLRKYFPGCSKIWELEKSWNLERLGRISFQDAWKIPGSFGILSLPGKIMKVENLKISAQNIWALLKTAHAQKFWTFWELFWWGLIISGTW